MQRRLLARRRDVEAVLELELGVLVVRVQLQVGRVRGAEEGLQADLGVGGGVSSRGSVPCT